MALENTTEIALAHSLISQAKKFEHNASEKSDLLDRAIVAADRSGSVAVQFLARRERLTVAVFTGEDELALTLFAWCQHMTDTRPDIIDQTSILWPSKWILPMLPEFSRINQKQIDAIAADMAKRFESRNLSRRPVYAKQSEVNLVQGNTRKSREFWERASMEPRDRYADCAACEYSHSVRLLVQEGRYEEAITAAQPILDGQLSCSEVPHLDLPSIMLTLYALGRKDAARELYNRSYRLICSNKKYIQLVAMLIEFQVAENELRKASQIAVRHLPWLTQTKPDKLKMHYIRALYCLLLVLADTAKEESLESTEWLQSLFDALEEVFEIAPGRTDLAQRLALLTAKIAGAGLATAGSLDARNANSYFTRQWHAPAFAYTTP
ncbi:tetratricopeptide repeat protein [Undibacterium sp. Ji42W]|uniref:tetratricopeptide repeat protein n=1 Tax=Undibacterium sp. Ji42W TaxID=3413039 RepID=UPI003BF21EDB